MVSFLTAGHMILSNMCLKLPFYLMHSDVITLYVSHRLHTNLFARSRWITWVLLNLGLSWGGYDVVQVMVHTQDCYSIWLYYYIDLRRKNFPPSLLHPSFSCSSLSHPWVCCPFSTFLFFFLHLSLFLMDLREWINNRSSIWEVHNSHAFV